jgi:hypothetical protein
MAGQLVEAAQVARCRLERHVLAHGDVLEVHQCADRALGERERGAQLLPLLRGKRAHDFLDDRGRQVARDIGELVGFERLRGGDQLAPVHRRDQRFAHRLGDLEQDFAVAIGLDEIPDCEPFGRRQRLQDVGDVGWMHAIEGRAQLGQALAFDQLLHLAQALLQILGLEPLLDLRHAQGTCTFSMRARIVSTRPAM